VSIRKLQKFILNSYGKKLKMDNMASDIINLFYERTLLSPHMKKEKVGFPDGY